MDSSEIHDLDKNGSFTGQDAPSSDKLTSTPTKNRSLSDSHPILDPSPKFREPATKARDDNVLIATPRHSRRAALSLQMPSRDVEHIFTDTRRTPYSPHLDGREAYISPTTVLPRHSRGLEISRACTSLHHSTSVDQATPDSSPIVAHKSMGSASRRASNVSMMLDSPRPSFLGGWPGMTNERGYSSRHFGSGTALTSDDSSSDEDEHDPDMRPAEIEDGILTTPQFRRSSGAGTFTPYGARGAPASGGWTASHSPMARGLPHFQRYSMEKHSSLRDPDANCSEFPSARSDLRHGDSMSLMRGSIDSDMSTGSPSTRRENPGIFTDGLRITTTDGESLEKVESEHQAGRPNLVRRPVVRRSNHLPKTKVFARIRAQLQEETAPVDSETKREAEVVRQVRVKDVGQKADRSHASSPDLTPTVIPNGHHDSSEMSDIEALPGLIQNFHANGTGDRKTSEERPRSNNKEFWPYLYNRMQTPPPPLFHRARSSSNMSEGESSHVSTPPSTTISATSGPMPSSSTNVSILDNITETPVELPLDPSPSERATAMPTQAEITRKLNRKRGRDEEFDPTSIKRRAVSPGMSINSSPVLGQSPVTTSGGWWGSSNIGPQRSAHGSLDEQGRSHSTTSAGTSISMGTNATTTPTLGPKRVGLQGMHDTSDGLMKMAID
ncbi:MAG: hypothetical protein M1828_000590 [Chrysothrix sp. TS-e1954]|nr:MAG: hypothetical protein M1828_000590 [Chrysothrix sp. TS-e1954]